MMLKQAGYNGLKTGITEAAGPCLSASYCKDGNHFIVILLNSKSMEARWQEVPQLVQWAVSRPQNKRIFKMPITKESEATSYKSSQGQGVKRLGRSNSSSNSIAASASCMNHPASSLIMTSLHHLKGNSPL